MRGFSRLIISSYMKDLQRREKIKVTLLMEQRQKSVPRKNKEKAYFQEWW